MLHSRDQVAGGSEGDVDGDQMEDRMMLRKAEGEDRSWSDSNGVCVYYIIFQLDRITPTGMLPRVLLAFGFLISSATADDDYGVDKSEQFYFS